MGIKRRAWRRRGLGFNGKRRASKRTQAGRGMIPLIFPKRKWRTAGSFSGHWKERCRVVASGKSVRGEDEGAKKRKINSGH